MARIARPNLNVYGLYAVRIRRKASTNEWVVRFHGCKDRENHGYYTDDYEDARGTASVMAKGPACCAGILQNGAE